MSSWLGTEAATSRRTPNRIERKRNDSIIEIPHPMQNGFQPTPFATAWWLPGAHPQTVWGRAKRSKTLVPMRREALETPDGDELLLDHLDAPSTPDAPRVI